MNYEYHRIDMMRVVIINIEEDSNDPINYLRTAKDSEYREDYQCFFVRKGTPTANWIALKWPELLK